MKRLYQPELLPAINIRYASICLLDFKSAGTICRLLVPRSDVPKWRGVSVSQFWLTSA